MLLTLLVLSTSIAMFATHALGRALHWVPCGKCCERLKLGGKSGACAADIVIASLMLAAHMGSGGRAHHGAGLVNAVGRGHMGAAPLPPDLGYAAGPVGIARTPAVV